MKTTEDTARSRDGFGAAALMLYVVPGMVAARHRKPSQPVLHRQDMGSLRIQCCVEHEHPASERYCMAADAGMGTGRGVQCFMPAFTRALRLDGLHSVPLHRAATMDFAAERLHLRFLAVHTRRANLWPSASDGCASCSFVRIPRSRPSRRRDYACQVHHVDD